jgi:type IV pilus assembly protein PilV
MVTRASPRAARRARGFSMIEVLVAIVIIAFGLLGIAGLQVRLQASEVEAYQRSQAMLLLADLKSRMTANRLEVGQYAVEAPLATPVGASMTCPEWNAGLTRVKKDISQWCNALQGAGETMDAGAAKVGAMVGGRGCVEDLGTSGAGDRSLRITVVWQGTTPIAAPVEACGAGSYNGAGASACRNDLCRRAVSTVVRIGKLAS